MKILVALTYYRPHISGLTIYVQRLAEALADMGHSVTVLTSRYDAALSLNEDMDGVRVVRVPVAFRLSKGVVMPRFGLEATRLVRSHDVLSLHLPQFDAAGLALRGSLMGRPTVLTYHCDLKLPVGLVNRAANLTVGLANGVSAKFADRIVAYTMDYAENSPFLSRYLDKVQVIPPPVEVPPIEENELNKFRDDHAIQTGPVIGMASRLAAEKGVEILLRALPVILERYPEARVMFAGQYLNVLGEAEYATRLEPLLSEFNSQWTFLGVLRPREMAAFFRSCDVTVLPSLNSTESFGLVQIESMICGTPVVASDLPGVRQPVLTTGMGKISAIGDEEALAQAILEVLQNPGAFRTAAEELRSKFDPRQTAAAYVQLFEELLGEV
ncbi:MAG: glycosyltransferase family 4 protein [Chloroflexi bacterium]|nr:glycosyltransferase family 4 protein [Chloroflexota bacterium]MCH8342316.1 glycosyltransferase family 4 protein [Chloroflexota bacterium]MCH8877277.1 glycosyltransferase family 4 protein [Chloroflexota bacterium]MCI0773139.1 glycosyltransferase family 4 protein [Chloroflexota bacterium]MCI0806267.1 glycosyltransferase family 4 protein [Chloroflexota bacterium]